MPSARKPPSSYMVLALLAGCVLYFVLSLSAGDRGVVDYIVIGLVCAAVLWNLIQLCRRLYAGAGSGAVWHVLRTVGFWLIGLFNTVLARPENIGTWKNYVGWAILALAVMDSILLIRKERVVLRASRPAHEQ